MIKSHIDNNSRHALFLLRKTNNQIKKAIEKAFDDIGFILQKETRDKTFAPKHGKQYLVRLKGRLKRHTASAPTQTPANLTGKYFRSIDYKKQGSNQLQFGSTVEHGKYLELGTKRMQPRPGLYNSIKDKQKTIKEYLEKRIKENISK